MTSENLRGYGLGRIWMPVLLVVLVPILALIVWIFGALRFSYATGERAGYVQKISKKGWLCKTWEGELAMVNLPGAMPEKFLFTVRDEKVAEDVRRTVGQHVALLYEQHVGLPTTCFGETEYFITSVRPVSDGPSASSPVVPAPAPAQ